MHGRCSVTIQFNEVVTQYYKVYTVPGQIRDHHSSKSVDQTNDRDTNQEHPPHPENQEIFLVEDVVVEDAEVVAPVNSSGRGSNVDVA